MTNDSFLFPEFDTKSDRGKSVSHVLVELWFPLEFYNIIPVVAGLPIGPGVAQRSKVHHRGGFAVRAPKFSFGSGIEGIEMPALSCGGVCAKEVLIKLFGQCSGRSIPV